MLPIDLLVRLRDQSEVDWRKHRHSKSGLFRFALPIAAGLLAFSLPAIAFVAAPAFTLVSRWAPLFVGSALFGAAIAWSRIARFRLAAGQGLIIGETCLVVIDEREVEVFPAEHITVADNGILYNGVLIDEAVHDGAWLERLQKSARLARLREAKATELGIDERQRDRFRAAAAAATQANPDPERAWVGPLVGAMLGMSGALFLEAGPAAIRGEHARAESRAATRDAKIAFASFDSLLAPLGEVGAKHAKEARASRIAQAKERHDRDLTAATTGTLADAAKFLEKSEYKDPKERETIRARYAGLVEKLVPTLKEAANARELLGGCTSLCTPAVLLKVQTRFITLAKQETVKARSKDELEPLLADAATYSLDEAFETYVLKRYEALSLRAALGGSIVDAREFLGDDRLKSSNERPKVQAHLAKLCGYNPDLELAVEGSAELSFILTLQRHICVQGTGVVTYRVETATSDDLAKQAMESLIEAFDSATLRRLGLSSLKVVRGYTSAIVQVSVKYTGTPSIDSDDPSSGQTRPCTLRYTLLDSLGQSTGKSFQSAASCKTRTTYSYNRDGGLYGVPGYTPPRRRGR